MLNYAFCNDIHILFDIRVDGHYSKRKTLNFMLDAYSFSTLLFSRAPSFFYSVFNSTKKAITLQIFAEVRIVLLT